MLKTVTPAINKLANVFILFKAVLSFNIFVNIWEKDQTLKAKAK